jgi:type I restriction enzyme S subunit
MKGDRVRFGSLFRIKHGYAFQSEFFDSSGEYALLTPGNFNEEGGFRKQGEKQRYYTGDVPESFILKEGDLIIAMTEQAEGLLGSSAIVPASNHYLHNQRLGLVVDIDGSRIDRRYLYYLFNTREVRHQISASASGTKVRHTAPDRIARVEVYLPAVSIQRRVAETLTAYDDLIANNCQRIELLEESVRLLYQEWFVRFLFPGHEHTKIKNGVPEGWRKSKISSLVSYLNRGIAPVYDDDAPGLVISQRCIRNGRVDLRLARHQSREFKPDKQVQIGDVLINSTGEGTLGRLGQLKVPIVECTVDSHVTIVRPKEEMGLHWFGVALSEWSPRLSSMGRGATNQTELSRDTIGEIEVLVPSPGLVRSFEEFADPVYRQRSNLLVQQDKLRTARDLLLPRLMSGEITL